MNSAGLKSISALADELGVTPAIIRSWQINLNLKTPKYGNDEAVFNAAWQDFFEKVAALRKEGHSFSKIRTVLAAITPPEKSLPEPGSQPVPSDNGSPLTKTQIFQPQELKKDAEKTVVRSELSSDELLGVYGPSTEMQGRPISGGNLMAASQNMALPALITDPKNNGGALQHLQSNMHEAILQKDLQQMTSTYVQLVENYQALASRYSESTYVIGQLEEKNRALEERLQQEQLAQTEKTQQMEAHVGSLKNMLDSQSNRLDQQGASLVTKEEIDQVEKQIKLLAITVFKQQQQQASSNQEHSGFWGRLKSLFSSSK
jgi:hypothetical protein